MSGCADGEDSCAVAMETEEVQPGERSMGELPEEVLEFILSFLSPYQEHKTAALVCKQWYRLIKGQRGSRLSQPERFFDEIHTYSPSKNWWNCIVTTQGPPPMAGHSSSVMGSTMVVFGGSLGARQMSNEVWVLDLEHWSWSKPAVSGPCPHPRGGQSQIVIDSDTLLILGGCGGPNALLKDAWLLHMSASPWTWQQLRVENEDHGAPELWCHPACKVGQCVVVFSQAPSGRAPLSPSMNSRPSPISSTPAPLGPEYLNPGRQKRFRTILQCGHIQTERNTN
ncbi:F-box only protein 42-like [Sinocyclocheilus rhinocerous]|uniref:F-box only protein 42-like n=1 Tax=Sinocyclocheilus rhinocerous TaxID=307959 RepID=UPI0007B8CE22|nr:PREDICTED: F-box only protein 42-like [Sinocyclocheilus rhinocerous]